MNTEIIISFIIVIIVFITIIIDKYKEAKKYRKDWEFCKKLLDEERNKNKYEKKEG